MKANRTGYRIALALALALSAALPNAHRTERPSLDAPVPMSGARKPRIYKRAAANDTMSDRGTTPQINSGDNSVVGPLPSEQTTGALSGPSGASAASGTSGGATSERAPSSINPPGPDIGTSTGMGPIANPGTTTGLGPSPGTPPNTPSPTAPGVGR